MFPSSKEKTEPIWPVWKEKLMPYQPNDLLSRHFEESGHDLINKVEEQLNLVSPNSPNTPIYRDMILTVLRMAQEDHPASPP
jgi:hypothetical protein